MRSRTNVHYLVFHLTLADTITSYVTLPMETLWRQGQRRYSSRIYVTFPKIYLWTFSKREIMARKVKLSKSIFWFRLNCHFIFTKAFFCTVPPFGRLSTHVLRLTIQWYAGNIMCKLLMMFRTGGYILSSLLLVVLSIDRSVNNLSGIISNVDITSPHVQTQVQLASLCICVWLYCPSDNLVWIKK